MLNIFVVDVIALILFSMRHTPSKDGGNQKETVIDGGWGVHTLIHESFTIAQNTQ